MSGGNMKLPHAELAEALLVAAGYAPRRMYDGPRGYVLFVTRAGRTHELRTLAAVQNLLRVKA